jgi:hypothetical protein
MRLPTTTMVVDTVSEENSFIRVTFFVLDFQNEVYICERDEQGLRSMDNFETNKTRLLLTGISIPRLLGLLNIDCDQMRLNRNFTEPWNSGNPSYVACIPTLHPKDGLLVGANKSTDLPVNWVRSRYTVAYPLDGLTASCNVSLVESSTYFFCDENQTSLTGTVTATWNEKEAQKLFHRNKSGDSEHDIKSTLIPVMLVGGVIALFFIVVLVMEYKRRFYNRSRC